MWAETPGVVCRGWEVHRRKFQEIVWKGRCWEDAWLTHRVLAWASGLWSISQRWQHPHKTAWHFHFLFQIPGPRMAVVPFDVHHLILTVSALSHPPASPPSPGGMDNKHYESVMSSVGMNKSSGMCSGAELPPGHPSGTSRWRTSILWLKACASLNMRVMLSPVRCVHLEVYRMKEQWLMFIHWGTCFWGSWAEGKTSIFMVETVRANCTYDVCISFLHTIYTHNLWRVQR